MLFTAYCTWKRKEEQSRTGNNRKFFIFFPEMSLLKPGAGSADISAYRDQHFKVNIMYISVIFS